MLQKSDPNSLIGAKRYAFLLLKFRLRSEKELIQRLTKKGFSKQVAEQTVIFLKEKKFIDDSFFAQSLIESKLKKSEGLRKIKSDLFLKGLEKKLIEEKCAAVKENYNEEETVKDIVSKKFNKLKDVDIKTAKRRIFAYLMRKGFSPDVASDCLNQIGNDES